MHEIKTLNSLSIFVGTSECNANCAHCVGIPLRKYAPKQDGIIDENLIYATIKECYEKGARYLSMSSSGEPTLSPLAVTKALKLVYRCKDEGIELSPINIYSNGIRIGNDKEFCETYLPLWKDLGLTTIYITVHDVDEKENAKIYRIEKYPSLDLVISQIHSAGLKMRANLLLSKKTVSNLERFVSAIEQLKKKGADYISAWPLRNKEDILDPILSPAEEELDKMQKWAQDNPERKIRLLIEKSKLGYQKGGKLTLFPDGTLSSTWCNN